MRLQTRTRTMLFVATVAVVVAVTASAQNLRVMGTTTGEGSAYFNSGAAVRGEVSVISPDSVGINALRLARTNENGRMHQWAFWHMNSEYGQDSLQLYEYQDDGKEPNPCLGKAADGAMCMPRFTIAKGGNVGVGVVSAAYRLDVLGDVHASGTLRTEGGSGWYDQSYGGGWFMYDSVWIRTNNDRSVWTGMGVLGSQGGLSIGYGGAAPPTGGAIVSGAVGIGTSSPQLKLDVRGSIAAGGSDIYFTDTNHAHSGYGNNAGYAAIENAANYGNGGTLMIMGRSGTAVGRRVDVYDYMQVNGTLNVTGSIKGAAVGPAIYDCPQVSCGSYGELCCGFLSTLSTCSWGNWSDNSRQTERCTLVGRLVAP